MATHDVALRVENLEVAYGKKQILFGVDLDIARGEVVTLLGANGSGKSTALNAISGFVRPKSGSVQLGAQEIAGLPAYQVMRAGVAQVSQARDLFPDMTVADNLKLGAIARGRVDQLEQIYATFPRLYERRDKKARQLSGGEQQMIALGRALMSEPEVLLLDEPSGGLSPHFVDEVADVIARLRAQQVTMLIVEQNLGLALRAADQYVILRAGQIAERGAVGDLGDDHKQVARRIYL